MKKMWPLLSLFLRSLPFSCSCRCSTSCSFSYYCFSFLLPLLLSLIVSLFLTLPLFLRMPFLLQLSATIAFAVHASVLIPVALAAAPIAYLDIILDVSADNASFKFKFKYVLLIKLKIFFIRFPFFKECNSPIFSYVP